MSLMIIQTTHSLTEPLAYLEIYRFTDYQDWPALRN